MSFVTQIIVFTEPMAILSFIIVVNLITWNKTIWPSTLCGLDPYLPFTNSASLLFVQNPFGLSGCGLSSFHLIGNITQYCLSLYLANTSSGTILSFCLVGNITQYCLSLYLANTSSGTIVLFCLVGNAIQYCLSLYLANTNSGTILSFMYFAYHINKYTKI